MKVHPSLQPGRWVIDNLSELGQATLDEIALEGYNLLEHTPVVSKKGNVYHHYVFVRTAQADEPIRASWARPWRRNT
jgi:hypothetical protein